MAIILSLAIEREAEMQKLFTLLGSPVFQSLSQIMDQDTSLEFLKWIMNRANFKGTSQIFELAGIQRAISQTGKEMGVQPNNMESFKNDVRGAIPEAIPDIVNNLMAQQPR